MSTIRERNKELILRAASEEFADKGFAATKTSDIAAKAGLPKPNVYYYFKSKENLYREVLESIIAPIMQASTPFNPDGDPKEVLSGYIRSKIRISRDLPHASKVFASEIMHGAPHLSPNQCSSSTIRRGITSNASSTGSSASRSPRSTRIT